MVTTDKADRESNAKPRRTLATAVYQMVALNAVQSPCPRCRNKLRFVIETENKSKTATIVYSYVCDVCKYRQTVESITLRMDGGKVVMIKNVKKSLS